MYHNSKLIRITTVPVSLAGLIRGQHRYMTQQGFEVVGVSSSGNALQEKYPFKNGFQTYYSSIKLEDRFFVREKVYSSKPLIMIGVGSLEMPYKGVAVLLQALRELNESGVDFKMTWIGDGKFLAEYKSFVFKNKLTEKVDFLGSVPNEDIPNYLRANNIFILPSLTEGLPRALIEAMASRLICLGSNVGGIPELLPEECLFTSNNPQEIVEKLRDILNNFEYYEKYSDINYNKALEYRPEILEKRRVNFYDSITENK